MPSSSPISVALPTYNWMLLLGGHRHTIQTWQMKSSWRTAARRMDCWSSSARNYTTRSSESLNASAATDGDWADISTPVK